MLTGGRPWWESEMGESCANSMVFRVFDTEQLQA